MDDREIIERLARLEQKVEDLEKKIDELTQMITQHNGYFKWMAIMMSIVLSFVAAMFGLGWRPPT